MKNWFRRIPQALLQSGERHKAAMTFTDDASIAGWAAEAVQQMQMAKILTGKDGNRFDPAGTATRAEVAAVLHRYVALVIDETMA